MALVLPAEQQHHTPGHSAAPVAAGGAATSRGRHPSGPRSSSSPPLTAGAHPSSSSQEPMGSVSSLIATRQGHGPYHEHHCRAGETHGDRERVRRHTVGSDSPSQDPLLMSRGRTPPPPKRLTSGKSLDKESRNGNYTYLNQDYVGDWNDNHVTPVSPVSDADEVKEGPLGLGGANVGGPPPRLIPVSGKLEKNMEKTLVRPTAFKPVVPKGRHAAMQYLSPRHGGASGLSESQSNLNLLSPAHRAASPASGAENPVEKHSSYSGGGGGGSTRGVQTCALSDSGRNSLSSPPPYNSAPYGMGATEGPRSTEAPYSTAPYGLGPAEGPRSNEAPYSTAPYGLGPAEAPRGHLEPIKNVPPPSSHATVGHHGHSNSDSGRSSSSKSTGSGSLGGRGLPLSDSGSVGGRSPAGGVEAGLAGYEGVLRDLEEKLRERDLELLTLRDNLDDNEAAICQVYEEKQKRCELELEELRQGCATRMQTASQKAQRAQQVLQLQVYQLQQEKKKLQEDFSQLLQEREQLEERCSSMEHEKIQLGPRLEETKWEVCQKSGEISLLKQQLKDVQGELAQRVGEIVSLRGQQRELRGELTNTQALLQEANSTVRTRSLEMEVCENELQRRKSEAELLREKVGRLEEEMGRLRDALAAASVQQGAPHPHPGNRQCQVFQESEDQLLAYEAAGDESNQRLGGGAVGAEPTTPRRHHHAEPTTPHRHHHHPMERLAGAGEPTTPHRHHPHPHPHPPQSERLRAELAMERRRAEELAGGFEEERRVWQEEKDKVIHYQKQLQQNYVSMYRRNRTLERALSRLSHELESRGEEDDEEGSGNEINFDEIAATEI